MYSCHKYHEMNDRHVGLPACLFLCRSANRSVCLHVCLPNCLSVSLEVRRKRRRRVKPAIRTRDRDPRRRSGVLQCEHTHPHTMFYFLYHNPVNSTFLCYQWSVYTDPWWLASGTRYCDYNHSAFNSFWISYAFNRTVSLLRSFPIVNSRLRSESRERFNSERMLNTTSSILIQYLCLLLQGKPFFAYSQ